MLKKIPYLLALVLIVGCAMKQVHKTTHNEKHTKGRLPANNSWSNYHWAINAYPSTLKLGNCLTTTGWTTHLINVGSDWNNPSAFGATSTPILNTIVNCTPTKRCNMVNGTTQVCNGVYGKNGWLGLASINVSGEHITQATAKMNDSYFSMATYNNPNEKRHVICQEVAHTFGLDHQSTDGSSQDTCMDYFSNTGANATSILSTKPNRHDFDELNLIYSRLDGFTTLNTAAVSPASQPSNVSVLDNPRQWGQLMSQSADGRGSFYERNNDDGTKTVTHVYWIKERAAKCPDCDHRDE